MASQQNGPCEETQINRHVKNFVCDLLRGHNGPHRDPTTGTRWKYPDGSAYGMKKKAGEVKTGGDNKFKGSWIEQHCMHCCERNHVPKTNACSSAVETYKKLKNCPKCNKPIQLVLN